MSEILLKKAQDELCSTGCNSGASDGNVLQSVVYHAQQCIETALRHTLECWGVRNSEDSSSDVSDSSDSVSIC